MMSDQGEASKAQTVLAQLHAETAKVRWPELERHFARGVVLKVKYSQDLVKIAAAMVDNETQQIASWMQSGDLSKVSVEDAKVWLERDAVFWAVVAAPWVLVQEIINLGTCME